MKKLARVGAAIVIATAAGSVHADDKCFGGSSKPFTVESWSASKISDATVALTFTITSHLKKKVRMIDVETGFRDALGAPMGVFDFGRDHEIDPGATFTLSRNIGILVVPRLTTVRPEDAEAYICTAQVLYDDGTKEQFK